MFRNEIDFEIKLIYGLILNGKIEDIESRKINSIDIFQKNDEFIIRHKFILQKFSGYTIDYEYYSFNITEHGIKQR